MTTLRAGTVAFLMTDIEGSTRLAAALGRDYASLLDRHFELLDGSIAGHGGTLVSAEGDSTFAVFPTVRQAVAGAIAAQRELSASPWPGEARVKVRMGIHVGEALRGGRDYTGLEVHRAARVAAAAWGGQILLTAAARALLADPVPDAATLGDLGPHLLRDIEAPEHIYQLVVPGLPADFPPLRAPSPQTPTNLPGPVTRFVGRERELTELRTLIESERLVTLTGPGGTGKTRLCIETARGLLERFPDGVWFIALESVRDPQLVIPTISQILGVPEQPGRDMSAVLADRLTNETALLVLDNFEQVVDAAPDIARLLESTVYLSIVDTSREPLAIGPERIYPVAPLAIPDEPGRPTADHLRGLASIELFVERARAVRPDFALTDENAAAIAAICRRLDGLPLAIELAAARLNVLGPSQILSRLDDRLSFLASSRRDLPERQRTLHGAIDWSHELLSDPERTVFRRLSAFSGGGDLEAIQAVVDPQHELAADVLDVVGALVDRSLVRPVPDTREPRFAMLETIREYAVEQLAVSGEASELEARHATYFTGLAEDAENLISDRRQVELLDRFDRELGNLRMAIAWSLRAGQPETGLRLVTALHEFWHLRNHIAEAVRALDELLPASAADGVSILRERALLHQAGLLTWLADDRARPLSEQGLAMAEELQDVEGLALAKSSLGWSLFYSDPERALTVFAEGLKAARSTGNAQVEIETLMGLTWSRLLRREYETAGELAREVVARGASTGIVYHTSFAMLTLGVIEAARGDLNAALDRYRDGLGRAHAAGAHVGTAISLDAIASVALERGDVPRGIRLAAAADRLRKEIGANIGLGEIGLEEPLTRAAMLVDPVEYERLAAEGRALSVDEAVSIALEDTASVAPSADH